MGRAGYSAGQGEASQFYFDYLKDAAVIFDEAIRLLKHCDSSQCSLAHAIDMAHRIKGNAAMYDYPQLGIVAAQTEIALRAHTDAEDTALPLLSLIKLIEQIKTVRSSGDTLPTPLTVVDTASTAISDSAPRPSGVPFAGKTILVAYQDAWVSNLITVILEPQFRIIHAGSGAQVRQALELNSPDLVIAEHDLGDMSGLSLLKEMRSSLKNFALPFFLAFDRDDNSAIAEAISLGVAGFCADKHEILDITQFAKDFLNKPPQSILVVDDDPMVRELLTHVLKADGLNVDYAADGIEALSYLSMNTPDLILLDRFMPRLEGGTVLYEIQNKINLKSIPVLILTAMVNQGEAKSWFERGAADFIPKPFDPEEVLMRVKRHLEKRQRIA